MAAITYPRATHSRASTATPWVYQRRRLVVGATVVVAAILMVLAVLSVSGWASDALGGGPLTASEAGPVTSRLAVQTVSTTTYVVASGDSLWSIARRLQPEGDVRPFVDRLAASRGGRPLQVGERIRLP